jgi:hypothetical protein
MSKAKPSPKKRPTARPKALEDRVPRPALHGDALYVRMPFTASTVQAIREHAENAVQLRDAIATGSEVSVRDFMGLCARTIAAIDRDLKRLRG